MDKRENPLDDPEEFGLDPLEKAEEVEEEVDVVTEDEYDESSEA